MTTKEKPNAPVIEAAGGLLWRETARGREIALIHRERHDDWSLPKGKRKKGETWQETALREVHEETGYQAKLVSFAGATSYLNLDFAPKVVLFWHMEIAGGDRFSPNAEVDDLKWFSAKEALKKLTYPDEQRLIK